MCWRWWWWVVVVVVGDGGGGGTWISSRDSQMIICLCFTNFHRHQPGCYVIQMIQSKRRRRWREPRDISTPLQNWATDTEKTRAYSCSTDWSGKARKLFDITGTGTFEKCLPFISLFFTDYRVYEAPCRASDALVILTHHVAKLDIWAF